MLDRSVRRCFKCGYQRTCSGCELPHSDELFDTHSGHINFAIHWRDEEYFDMRQIEEPDRDASAPDERRRSSSLFQPAAKVPPVSLGDCIDCFTTEETLAEEDAWFCPKCTDHRCAKKKIDIWKCPDVLVIVLKRFQYSRYHRDKISTLCDFPTSGLDILPWVVNPAPGSTIYDLYAVSNHMGGMGGGHYNAYAQNLVNEKWYCLDDSRVSELSGPGESVSTSAYILYYRKRGLSTEPLSAEDLDEDAMDIEEDDTPDELVPARV